MAHLHDLTGEYLALQAAIEGSEDEGSVLEALAKIGDVEDNIERKHIGIAFAIRNAESELEVLTAEAERIADKRARLSERIADSREFLRNAMAIVNVEKFKGPSFSVSRRKNNPKVLIDDESLVHPMYCHPLPPPPPPPKGKVNFAKVLAELQALPDDAVWNGLPFLDFVETVDLCSKRRGNPEDGVNLSDLIEADLRFCMEVPDEYRHPPCGAPDKKAIADAFKKLGETVPGTRVEQGERIEIK
jgi:hypothetical protein